MADTPAPTSPPLKVVPKEDPNADLIALAAGALAKAKEEIRAEVKKEILTTTGLMGLVLYFLLDGGRGSGSKLLRRLTGG
jgi:hypothetical protein